MSIAVCFRRQIFESRRSWLAMAFGLFCGFQIFQLAVLMLRFEAFPNYVTFHDWPGNVAQIVRSTPAVADMIPIIFDEWFIEIGSINYSFGRGIAEWSFVLIPGKLVVVLAIAALVATDLILLRAARKTCRLSTRVGTAVATATGAMVAGAAATTITWVVCCAAPTWVVGLAVMGVGVSTALALQPIGGWMLSVGLVALAGIAVLLAAELSGHGAEAAASLPAPVQIARVTS